MLHAWMGVQHTQAVGSNIRHTDMRKKSSNNKPSIDGLSPLLHQQLCVLVELHCRSLSKSAGVTFSNFTWRKMDIPMECRKGGVQTVCTGKGLSVQRDLSIRGPVCSILRVPIYHLLVIALASPLACGRLSPELGSSRLGEMVEEGLEAPLLALGLDLIGLARARLVRASRVPSGSTMIFMATEQTERVVLNIYPKYINIYIKYQYYIKAHSQCAAVKPKVKQVHSTNWNQSLCSGEGGCVSVESHPYLLWICLQNKVTLTDKKKFFVCKYAVGHLSE